jgi:hypothetical protein
VRITGLSTVIKQKLAAPSHLFGLLLISYRWVSLITVLYLLQTTTQPETSGALSLFLLLVAAGVTLFMTIFDPRLEWKVSGSYLFLGLDLLPVAVLLTFSGAHQSPYYLYALSPFLTAAFFFQLSGAFLAIVSFTPVYLLLLITPARLETGWLLAQLVRIWLMTLLFGTLSELLKQLQQTQVQPATAHQDLARQHAELAASHQNLAKQKAALAAVRAGLIELPD